VQNVKNIYLKQMVRSSGEFPSHQTLILSVDFTCGSIMTILVIYI